ncbi:MAG: class I SAM-dependent methyltransferase [Thiohalomonadaceae bacterium]
MNLRHSYTLFAPIYDLAIEGLSRSPRAHNLQALQTLPLNSEVLLPGIGSGLDIPHLPYGHRYTGLDLTPAMLRKAEQRATGREDIQLQLGDAMALPFADASFDVVVLHLILAVVPEPERLLCETERVLRPGGKVLLLDKFLRPGQRAPIRRLLNLASRHLATRTDVVFEEVLAHAPSLQIEHDRPALAGGWFRHIQLRKDPACMEGL